ncbi:MAG: MgtC/SapB family protein [Spirochaetales bacterium]|nr:MgtC/SapB family protein [Candidatus Physcosoma equi]
MPEFTIGCMLQVEFLIRLLIAACCGAAIGWEREKRLKSAGLRTHMLVAVAATLMILISKYGFLDIVYLSSVQVDASRMAAGVVQAIGFLGAGVIFVKRDTIVGITTAAGLWATVGIGLAIGAGLYILGIVATIILLGIQLLVHKKEHKTFSTNTGSIMINMTKHNMTLAEVKEKLEAIHITIRNIAMIRDEGNDLILNASIVCSRAASIPDVLVQITNTGFIDGIDIYTVE